MGDRGLGDSPASPYKCQLFHHHETKPPKEYQGDRSGPKSASPQAAGVVGIGVIWIRLCGRPVIDVRVNAVAGRTTIQSAIGVNRANSFHAKKFISFFW